MINYKELIKNFSEDDFKFQRVNLHIHTNHSDGEADFDELLEQAKIRGYKYIAITDHNTMNGYFESKFANSSILIPGVEFDAWCGYVFMHLLAYGVDKNHEKLKSFFANNKKDATNVIPRLFSKRKIKELIDTIHDAGGIAVLAHPCCCWAISLDKFVQKLKELGLDGIEAYYPYPRLRGVVKFHKQATPLKLAKKYDLIITGGTDLHEKSF
ncbi:PHP domain-containing protein [bacterium]|nr:PHP domain-containing protein [bacterium]